MGEPGHRATCKMDPKELLGLVALSSGRERLRPTCEMPKLELASLLAEADVGAAAPLPRAPERVALGTSPIVAIAAPVPAPTPVPRRTTHLGVVLGTAVAATAAGFGLLSLL